MTKNETIASNLEFKPQMDVVSSRRRLAFLRFLRAFPFWVLIGGFIILILGMTLTVLLTAFSTNWYGTVLPKQYSLHWFLQAWQDYNIWSYYKITLEITVISTVVSLCLSIPGAYVLARRSFPLKGFFIGFYQLPFMLPEIVYALPLASIFYSIGLAETIPGLVLAQILIGIPFSLFIIIPFIESLDSRLEAAAQSLGANRFQLFTRIVVPQLIPGITAAAINIFIRMFSTFLIILLIAGTDTQTLPVMVFTILQSAGSQPPPEIASLTVSLMFPLLAFTFVSLWFTGYTRRKVGK